VRVVPEADVVRQRGREVLPAVRGELAPGAPADRTSKPPRREEREGEDDGGREEGAQCDPQLGAHRLEPPLAHEPEERRDAEAEEERSRKEPEEGREPERHAGQPGAPELQKGNTRHRGGEPVHPEERAAVPVEARRVVRPPEDERDAGDAEAEARKTRSHAPRRRRGRGGRGPDGAVGRRAGGAGEGAAEDPPRGRRVVAVVEEHPAERLRSRLGAEPEDVRDERLPARPSRAGHFASASSADVVSIAFVDRFRSGTVVPGGRSPAARSAASAAS
jgi:hypothetical protein